jgi:hydroxymethylpyrimidine/phosphomethylpyrimidine kinase
VNPHPTISIRNNSGVNQIPCALTIAGSDSGGGAGIQADIKTFSALGVYACSAISAITAQNTLGVHAVVAVNPALITEQIRAVIDDFPIAAIKIGMLPSKPAIIAVADLLQTTDIPIILDPVMVAKSGDALMPSQAVDALRTRLLPLATLITPNLPEAAALLDSDENDDPAIIQSQGEQLLDLGARAVLMKGGHARGDRCTDRLIQPKQAMLAFRHDRVATQNTHGTGCTLSAAIAAYLALGYNLVTACERAHDYLYRAIVAADSLGIGHDNTHGDSHGHSHRDRHGPVHHFHNIWPSS